MNERQLALANYVRTLGPSMNGVKSPSDFLARLMRCVAEDADFLKQGGLMMLEQAAQNFVEKKSKEYIGSVAGMIDKVFQDLGKKHRK